MSAPPHDLDAETRLVGALIHDPSKIPTVTSAGLMAEDFYGTRNGAVYSSIVDLYTGGHLGGDPAGDLTVLGNDLASRGTPVAPADLLSYKVAGYSRPWSLVPIVQGHAVRRRLLGALSEATMSARDLSVDPVTTKDRVLAELGQVEVPLANAVPDSLSQLSDFLAAADTAPQPWVVPGMFRRDWRVVIVAGEGSGKSVLCRQVAMCAARGIHPLVGAPMVTGPIRTLIVDLENPAGAITDIASRIETALDGVTNVTDDGRSWIWHEQAGVNLRAPRDRVRLEAVVAHARPDLVVIGPGYKLYRKDPGQSDEDAVGEVFAVLDDLRSRYGFALLIEHHAPKGGQGFGMREMEPHGTVLWKRWPEIGIGAIQGDGDRYPRGSLVLNRWRGDRMANEWPDRVDRSSSLPWAGVWKGGVPSTGIDRSSREKTSA